jgi:hypothetical protein
VDSKLDEITPGQWHYEDGQVKDDRGEIVARAYREAECKISPYQRDNNMRFISAAPDMYEALKAITDSVVCNGDFTTSYAIDGTIKQLIKQALAKAEGRV